MHLRLRTIFSGSGFDLKSKIPYCRAIVAAIFLLAWAPNLHALSLGPIQVKSNFGERFDAEIELTSEEGGNVSVAIGTQKDYDMLQVNRAKIVDKLRIDRLVSVGRGKEIIRIKSEIPLFFPSFNLVVRVSRNGGTLLENYLITVDFQQMVSLGVLVDKKGKKETRSSLNKPVDLLQAVRNNDSAATPRDVEKRVLQHTPEAIPPKEIVTSRSRKPPRMKLAIKAPAASLSASPITRKEKSMMNPAVIPPMPVIIPSGEHSADNSRAPALLPKNFSRLATAQSSKAAGRREIQKQPVLPLASEKRFGNATVRLLPGAPVNVKTSQAYGPLAEGETLSKIAAKLKIDSAGEAKVTVAIWLDNGGQFIGGNIHGIRKGAILNLGNVQKRLGEISARVARMILLNHWREWKIIKQKLSRPVENEARSPIQEILLPAEKIPDKAEIFRLLETWRQSWESKDIGHHMACFSKRFRVMKAAGRELQFTDWQEFKLRMFARYDDVTIRIHRPKLIQMGDRLLVAFDQSFESDKLHSFGYKTLELVRESGRWKIVSERFKPKPPAEKGSLSLFVVHSSSHGHFDEALHRVNELRQKGLNAYFSALNLTRHKIIYRVFVERFSEWALAAQMARFLRAWEAGQYAIPSPVPFSLLTGSFEREARAAERIDGLRKNGISAFLFSTSNGNFANPTFNVLVGAYSQEAEAQAAKSRLAELGIPFRLIAA